LRANVFLGISEISKNEFFRFLRKVSDKVYTSKKCANTFKRAGLVPFNPQVVYDAMERYGGFIRVVEVVPEEVDLRESTLGFGTLPPPDWTRFTTPRNLEQR
jgi:hypothetical protein